MSWRPETAAKENCPALDEGSVLLVTSALFNIGGQVFLVQSFNQGPVGNLYFDPSFV